MNAEQIRKAAQDDSDTDFLAEIAAQLADLNENLKEVTAQIRHTRYAIVEGGDPRGLD